ncbi:5-formyltetrahydrofolate cyclo-ligase [Paramagnetospirillum marisnigri]|uniref:5-formyltetrahydrofolate cyclo-ligase n=1 Tax=Paramagnetospirillum marisnigri TaxID=1285242 RepID=A0A178MCQ7_9PROT|nr:5-formyltetrahydrofolate cyclo-ligase [Paramagnetospirillum marisnigri]OAN45644.1 5-formyltetrahydrofolate cyclo-ligase [Paramagnetospirillum marisnigri]
MIQTSPDPKMELRRHARVVRADAASRLGVSAGEALADQADGLELAPGAVVAGYWPLADEIDPRPLMRALAARGHPLALPVVVGRETPLEFRSWSPDDPLDAGPHGTRHPPTSAERVTPDVVLVPLLCFDAKGFRLGYGGGYYDRTLAALRRARPVLAVGLAFAAQRVEAVPAEAWDQGLDKIATEQGVVTVEQA